MSDAFKPLLSRLAEGRVLSEDEAEAFLAACLMGEATPAQLASALTALRVRGETVGEIAAFVRAMHGAMIRLEHPYDAVDTCGTGGDGQHTFNVSTAAAFVLAGAGVKVAKHGNRALSSKSGSSDVLGAVGVNLQATLEQQRRALDEAGVCFMFAPVHHPAMRHVTPVRAEMGFRTVFNILGPLSNPAGVRRQVMGVYDPRWLQPIAETMGRLGAVRSWTVHGQGLDELTTTGETEVCEWRNGQVRRFTVTPEDAGVARTTIEALRGGAPEDNARALLELLDGAVGPYRDIVVLNAAAALVVADRAETLAEGAELARQSLDAGAARTALDRLVAVTNEPVE